MKRTKLENDRSDTPSRRKRGRGNPLTESDRAAIQALSLAGVPGTAIAEGIGCSPKSVYRVLETQEFEQTKQLARSVLASRAPDVANAWVDAALIAARDGKHEAARDLLQGIEAIQKPGIRNADGKRGLVVQVGIVLPGLGIEQPPSFTMPSVIAQQIEDGEVLSTTDDDTDPIQ